MFRMLIRNYFKKEVSCVRVVKPNGNESLIRFFERIEKELSENRYGDFVVLDCGEEVRVIADIYSTKDSIYKAYEKEFLDGYNERYRRFENKVAKIKK